MKKNYLVKNYIDFGDFRVCKKMSDPFCWREFLGYFDYIFTAFYYQLLIENNNAINFMSFTMINNYL